MSGYSRCFACNLMKCSIEKFCSNCASCTTCNINTYSENLYCNIHNGNYCYDCATNMANVCKLCKICNRCEINEGTVKCISKNCHKLLCKICADNYNTCNDCRYAECGWCENTVVTNFCVNCGEALCESCVYGQILPGGTYCINCSRDCAICDGHARVYNKLGDKFYCMEHVDNSVVSCNNCKSRHRQIKCGNKYICQSQHRCEKCFDIITNCTFDLSAEISIVLLSMHRYRYPPRPIREYILRLAFNKL